MPPKKKYQPISGHELYRNLAGGKAVIMLDVRTEEEFAERHIPGSLLIPLQELDARIAEVPNSGMPIAVVSAFGLRGGSACQLLAENDYAPIFNLEGGLKAWPGPVSEGLHEQKLHQLGITPSSFLVENFDHLPQGLALDLAMGEGRNAIYMASRGFDVDGVDPDSEMVASARCSARKLGVPIRAVVGNLEDGTYIIPVETYNVIIGFNYLRRRLFKEIKEGLVPGGIVVFQASTLDQVRFGRPHNPDHLLESGELKLVFAGYEVLNYRELIGPSRKGGKMRAIASIIARKPA